MAKTSRWSLIFDEGIASHDDTASTTPRATARRWRMLPRVIGGPAMDRGRVLMPGEDTMAAFDESCRRSGHVLTARFDPL
jgi:hypothetical protein